MVYVIGWVLKPLDWLGGGDGRHRVVGDGCAKGVRCLQACPLQCPQRNPGRPILVDMWNAEFPRSFELSFSEATC